MYHGEQWGYDKGSNWSYGAIINFSYLTAPPTPENEC
jgi:hypothetical protein